MSFLSKTFNTAQLHFRGNLLASRTTKSIISRNQGTKTTSTVKFTSLDHYNAQKRAAKDRRAELYDVKVARAKKLKTRRDNNKKNYNKNLFRSWFDPMTSRQKFLDREARRQGMKWNIKVSAMIERLPIITPDKHDWEKDYMDLHAKLSKYDNIRYPKEFGFADPMEQEILSDEELYAMLPEGFTPAPRITEADKSGDIKTLNRKLNTRVYLSVKPNEEEGWILPTTDLKLDEKETFLEGAKRVTKSVAGNDLILLCISNCPMGVDCKEYSEEEKAANGSKVFGEKTFYMRVQYDDGSVNENKMKKMDDWGWLTREEMVENILDKGDEASKFYKYLL